MIPNDGTTCPDVQSGAAVPKSLARSEVRPKEACYPDEDSIALLHGIWRRAEVLLGVVTIRAIFERAIHTTAQVYPGIKQLDISGDLPRTSALVAQTGSVADDSAARSLTMLSRNVLALLTELTGRAIVGKVFGDELAVISRCQQLDTQLRKGR